VALLVGCSQSDLPSYWRCQGDTSQVLKSAAGQELEKYSGNTLLLLESFRGTVTQYISIPFTGVYQECVNNADELSFGLGTCDTTQSPAPVTYFRKGTLDKHSGKLNFSEVQANSQGLITNQGTFQCEYLGHTYPASIFYSPKKQGDE